MIASVARDCPSVARDCPSVARDCPSAAPTRHCEERSDAAIPRLTSLRRFVPLGIAASLRSSQ
jgi:hypothetical protein